MTEFVSVVVGCSWWPGSTSEEPRMMVWLPDGRLPSAPVSPELSPVQAAQATLQEIPVYLEKGCLPRLEPVTFVEQRGGTVALVFTTAIPAPATLVNAEGLAIDDPRVLGWVDVSGQYNPSDTAQLITLAKTHWRQQLEETSAVFDFLPRYFTTPQARSIYDSVWGYPQDPGNFHRWLHKQNTDICREVDAQDEVVPQRDATVAKILAKKKAPAQQLMPLGSALAGTVGASMFLPALGVPMVGLAAAALTGGTVAFQAMKTRGPKPQWFKRNHPHRRPLETLYGPRPSW